MTYRKNENLERWNNGHQEKEKKKRIPCSRMLRFHDPIAEGSVRRDGRSRNTGLPVFSLKLSGGKPFAAGERRKDTQMTPFLPCSPMAYGLYDAGLTPTGGPCDRKG
jgi:hypothetical protein